MDISAQKVRDKVEDIKLKASDKGFEWVVEVLEEWEIELDTMIAEYGKGMESNYNKLLEIEDNISKH